MKKHMMHRFQTTDDTLQQDMDKLAAELEALTPDQMMELYARTHEVTELDFKISKIDAIQAELWRRSQNKDG